MNLFQYASDFDANPGYLSKSEFLTNVCLSEVGLKLLHANVITVDKDFGLLIIGANPDFI